MPQLVDEDAMPGTARLAAPASAEAGGRGPGWKARAADLAAWLLLLAATCWYHAPLAAGEPPLSWDHNVHLYRALENRPLLDAGRLLGWSLGEYAGSAPMLTYHCGGDLLVYLVERLSDAPLGTAYAWALLLAQLIIVSAAGLAVRLHSSALAGLLAGLLVLCDPGEMWLGGAVCFMRVGLWETSVAASLVFLFLAGLPRAVERRHGLALLVLGGLLGVAVLFTPLGLIMAACGLGCYLLALPCNLSWAGLRTVTSSGLLVAVGFTATAAAWLVPYLLGNEARAIPGLLPFPSGELWKMLTQGGLLTGPPLWSGAALCGWGALLARPEPASRSAAIFVPLSLLLACDMWSAPLLRHHPDLTPWVAALLLPRVLNLTRLVGAGLAGMLLCQLLTEAGARVLTELRSRQLRWPVLAALLALGLMTSLRKPLAELRPPLPHDLGQADLEAAQRALDIAQTMLRNGGRVALVERGPDPRSSLMGLAALRGLPVHLLADYGASMAPGRFYTDDPVLLGRLGVTALVAHGDLPPTLSKLPEVARCGGYTVHTVTTQPQAWMEGPGEVTVERWAGEAVRVRIQGAGPGAEVRLMLGWTPAWACTPGAVVQPFRLRVQDGPHQEPQLTCLKLGEPSPGGAQVVEVRYGEVRGARLGAALAWGALGCGLALAGRPWLRPLRRSRATPAVPQATPQAPPGAPAG